MDPRRRTAADPAQKRIAEALNRMRSRLLDLSGRNRLLNFRHPRRTSLRVIDELPDQLWETLLDGKSFRFIAIPKPPKQALPALRMASVDEEESESEQPITPVEVAKSLGISTSYEMPVPLMGRSVAPSRKHLDKKIQTLLFPEELETTLRKIRSTARTAIEESGANMLYLALGFLEWTESDASERTRLAPLLLLPVVLDRGSVDHNTGTFTYIISYSGEDILPNLSLGEVLKKDFGLVLPDYKDEELPETYFRKFRGILKSKPTWKLRRYITLSLFHFGKLLMYLDLDPRRWSDEQNITQHKLIRTLLDGQSQDDSPSAEEYDIDKVPDLLVKYPTIYDADSSQLSALIDAFEGRSFVIEGPPGTGKSQTITNLIAAAIAQEKTILFVSEKLAALEVVRNRLDNAGLGDFCLELHSRRTQKRALIEDIDRRLRSKGNYDQPEDFHSKITLLEKKRDRLAEYAALLNSPYGNIQKSIYDVIWSAIYWRGKVDLSQEYRAAVPVGDPSELDLAHMDEMVGILEHVQQQFQTIVDDWKSLENHPWYGFENSSVYGPDLPTVVEQLPRLRAAMEAVQDSARDLLELGEQGYDPTAKEAQQWGQPENNLAVPPEETCFDVLRQLESPNIQGNIEVFLSLLEKLNSLRIELKKHFSDPDALTEQSLSDLAVNLGRASPLFSSDTRGNEIEEFMKSLRQTSDQITRIETQREQFCAALAKSLPKTWKGLELIQKIVDCAARAPTHLLDRRDALFEKPGMTNVIVRGKTEKGALLQRKRILEKEFDLLLLPEPGELLRVMRILAFAGWFSWLTRDWWYARRVYKSFALQRKRTPSKTMAKNIRRVLEFQSDSEKFVNDPLHRRQLQHLFQGLDTDFEALETLAEWYVYVRATLDRTDPESKSIAAHLFSASPVVLESVGQFKQSLYLDIQVLLKQLEVIFLEGKVGDELKECDSLLDSVEFMAKVVQLLNTFLNKWSQSGARLTLTLTELTDGITMGKAFLGIKESANSNAGAKKALGENFRGTDTDPNFVRATLQVAQSIRSSVFPDGIKRWLFRAGDNKSFDVVRNRQEELHQRWLAFAREKNEFLELGRIDWQKWDPEGEQGTLLRSVRRIERALHHEKSLSDLLNYLKAKVQVEEAGFAALVKLVETGKLPLFHLTSVYKACVYHQLVEDIFRQYPLLRRFQGSRHETLRQDFVKLDKEILQLQRRRIASIVDSRRVPAGISRGPKRDHTDMGLIRGEISKQKRHIPIRQLVNRAGHALRALKPCFMMGPLSVAQYIEPGSVEFDIVVMDEASQLRTEEALGAIARGKQVIIVGDPKQLPPTRFFDRMIDEEELEEEDITAIEEAESILQVGEWAFHPKRRLRWHYRSQHESLIAFSNHHFYDGDLIVFPSPLGTGDELGVKYEYVPRAQYKGSRNREEAEVIARAALNHMQKHPKDTLGIVSMNIQQKDLIEGVIDRLIKEDPVARTAMEQFSDGEEPFFVKNLENVQGDERDAIFISFTYGRDATGALYYRFGPINSTYGWRRLNVLFTRARKRVVAFTSMSPDEIKILPNDPRGKKALRDYLAYARDGTLIQPKHSNRPPDSDFEKSVASALEKYGYECIAQLGVAGYFLDIAIRHPERPGNYILGIECDGASYHRQKSVRDRDRLRQEVLEHHLGWRIHRIWSTDWFANPERETTKILSILEKLRKQNPVQKEAQRVTGNGRSAAGRDAHSSDLSQKPKGSEQSKGNRQYPKTPPATIPPDPEHDHLRGPENWLELLRWGRRTNHLSPYDQNLCIRIRRCLIDSKEPSSKQKDEATEMWKAALRKGFRLHVG